MIDTRSFNRCYITSEMSKEDLNYWFDFKKKKFMHNIDTFYYSVKLCNDFTSESQDQEVEILRKFFEVKKNRLNSSAHLDFIAIDFDGHNLNLKPYSFANMYSICLECPDWFDVFIAPTVPKGSDGGESLTCEIIVQIRSYMLWMYGVHEAFVRSYEYVKAVVDYFDLQIAYCQENRIDYCWHTNYLSNPEKFFSLENFYKMRVDRFHDAVTHTEKVGSSGYEIDYIAVGKRSDKVFIRIYLKSKEVVEQGYKGWFLYTWLFNGLINRYDLYVYEECYKRKSWKYMNMARIAYYVEYGQNEALKITCKKLLDGTLTMEEDNLQSLADDLTPKVNLILNVEYQTMRRHTKSYQLLPLRDNSAKETAKRIYDYLDNRKLITDYLTYHVFRLVKPDGDVNKSRRDLCGFWEALRSCKLVDVHIPPKQLKLIRDYSRKLNGELVKTRAINSAINFGMYVKGFNTDEPVKDIMDMLCQMNDNDMQKAIRYKKKRTHQFSRNEMMGALENIVLRDYGIVDRETGEIYEYDSISSDFLQGGSDHDN